MRRKIRYGLGAATVAVAGAFGAIPGAVAQCAPAMRRTACSPKGSCAAKAGCSAKPGCAPKRGCGPKAGCKPKAGCGAAMDKVDRKLVTRPAGYKPYRGDTAELVRTGEALFKDTKLSTNGMSCNTCHQAGGGYAATFAKPYPHYVQMVSDRAGLKQVHADEMVQLCMVVPMASKPLAWESKELAALTAYVTETQKTYKPTTGGAKPGCGAKAGCGPKAGCGAKASCAPKCAPKCSPKPKCTPKAAGG